MVQAAGALPAASRVPEQAFLPEAGRARELAPDLAADRRGQPQRPGGRWARLCRRRSFLIRGKANGRDAGLSGKAIRRQ
jgi:hypothetical protein